VRVISGEVYDVAVDIRKSSPNFGQHAAETLSAENRHMMWVPSGFAHGFFVLSETAEFIHKCADYYAPEYEKSLLWNDPDLNIDWPIEGDPELSQKDREGAKFADSEYYLFNY
jgi:dTDP-4-dehydrorhamnose 3,5-epimerase